MVDMDAREVHRTSLGAAGGPYTGTHRSLAAPAKPS